MARHRDIRNMDYSEDYDGYDDVYGHSVDDDYCISPSNGHFIFNRDSLRERSTQEKTTESSEKASIEESKFESSLSDAAMPVTETINVEKEFDDNITEGIDLMHLHERIVAGDGTKIKEAEKSHFKFEVPKLNGGRFKNIGPFVKNMENSESKFDDNSSDLHDSDAPKFNNLLDLVNNHLSSAVQGKVPTESDDSMHKRFRAFGSATSPISTNNYHVDLSSAIKFTPQHNALPASTSKMFTKDDFKIRFIDCEVDLQPITANAMICALDVKYFLKIRCEKIKVVSHFGNVLCRKQKLYTNFVLRSIL